MIEIEIKEISTLGEIIKKHILIRGKTMKEVALELEIPYTTFSGILNRDSIDSYLLFKLKKILDIDLEWVYSIIEGEYQIGICKSLVIPRMGEKKRLDERKKVDVFIKMAIKENPKSISDTRNYIMKNFNMYYLMDVLLSEDYEISTVYERRKIEYYCIKHDKNENIVSSSRMISGKEILENIIMEMR